MGRSDSPPQVCLALRCGKGGKEKKKTCEKASPLRFTWISQSRTEQSWIILSPFFFYLKKK